MTIIKFLWTNRIFTHYVLPKHSRGFDCETLHLVLSMISHPPSFKMFLHVPHPIASIFVWLHFHFSCSLSEIIIWQNVPTSPPLANTRISIDKIHLSLDPPQKYIWKNFGSWIEYVWFKTKMQNYVQHWKILYKFTRIHFVTIYLKFCSKSNIQNISGIYLKYNLKRQNPEKSSSTGAN